MFLWDWKVFYIEVLKIIRKMDIRIVYPLKLWDVIGSAGISTA